MNQTSGTTAIVVERDHLLKRVRELEEECCRRTLEQDAQAVRVKELSEEIENLRSEARTVDKDFGKAWAEVRRLKDLLAPFAQAYADGLREKPQLAAWPADVPSFIPYLPLGAWREAFKAINPKEQPR